MARAILEKVLILLPCQLKTQSLTHCRDLLGRNPRLKLIAYQGSVHNCFSASQKQSFWHGLKVNIQRVPAMFELHGSFPPRQRRGADKSGNIPDGTTWWPLDDIITHKHIFIYIYIDHIYICGNIQGRISLKFTQFWAGNVIGQVEASSLTGFGQCREPSIWGWYHQAWSSTFFVPFSGWFKHAVIGKCW